MFRCGVAAGWSGYLGSIGTLPLCETKLGTPAAAAGSTANVARPIQAATGRPIRPSVACTHEPPSSFHPGQPLSLSLLVSGQDAPDSVHLSYRHVNQGERWQSVEMQRVHNGFSAAIPGDYTNSVYPLQYYLLLRRGADAAWFFPRSTRAFRISLTMRLQRGVRRSGCQRTVGSARHRCVHQ